MLMLEQHPHRTLTKLGRIPPTTLGSCHDSILSRTGASTDPGGIQIAHGQIAHGQIAHGQIAHRQIAHGQTAHGQIRGQTPERTDPHGRAQDGPTGTDGPGDQGAQWVAGIGRLAWIQRSRPWRFAS
jgi:hypothetical protein